MLTIHSLAKPLLLYWLQIIQKTVLQQIFSSITKISQSGKLYLYHICLHTLSMSSENKLNGLIYVTI